MLPHRILRRYFQLVRPGGEGGDDDHQLRGVVDHDIALVDFGGGRMTDVGREKNCLFYNRFVFMMKRCATSVAPHVTYGDIRSYYVGVNKCK